MVRRLAGEAGGTSRLCATAAVESFRPEHPRHAASEAGGRLIDPLRVATLAEGQARRLDSWKEIADYLAHDVRTAIRWEHERGLPVHRVPGGKRGSIFAFTDEIDRWLVSVAVQADHTRESAAEAVPGPESPEPAHGGRRARVRPRWVALLAGGLVVLTLLGIAFRADHSRRRPGVAPIATISLAGTRLTALDRDQSVLWQHDFGRELGAAREDTAINRVPAIFSAADDIDGDGAPDLLVSVPFRYGESPSSPDQDELFAFTAQGRVLWSNRIDDALTFGGGKFSAPWRLTGPLADIGPEIVVFELDGRKHIAWAQSHHTWWPSILTVLDGSGRRLSSWVHSGNIHVVTIAPSPAGARLLVGGVSNSREAAFLAVLDARHVEGAGPEEAGSPFECLSCGPGRPLRYFVIEPSELLLATSPYNALFIMRPDERGVEVRTLEGDGGAAFRPHGIARFSRQFDLEHVAWDSMWNRRHRELERAGKLDHSLHDCPERDRPPRVREWTPESGWRDVTPPPVAVASARAAETLPEPALPR